MIGCRSVPHDWTRPPDLCRACTDPDLLTAMWEAATVWVYQATCYQFPGVTVHRIAPCYQCAPGACQCSGCGNIRRLDLSNALCFPIVRTDSVTAGPNAGPPLLLKVWEGPTEWVYGTDFWLPGAATIMTCKPSWPAQDHCLTPRSVGTWEIEVATGRNPPRLVVQAAADLACELAKAATGLDSCLPDGVKSISRRGVTMDLAETITFDSDDTGIPTLNLVLKRWGCKAAHAAWAVDPLEDVMSGWSFTEVAA